MAQNLKMDPVKRDYVVENGSPVASDRVEEQTYFALLIPNMKWLYGTVDQGSLLYMLNNRKRSGSIEQEFAAYARNAVQKNVIDAGQASAVAIKNLATSPTGTSNQVAVVPKATQLTNQISFTPV